jgi:phosphatidylglycerophosphate synthase
VTTSAPARPTPEPRESVRATVARLAEAQKSSKGAPAYSRFVNRPLGRVLAALAYRFGLTPNGVSAISAAFSLTGILVLAFARPGPLTALVISGLLVIGYAFDAADGQLARLRGGGSLAGEWLDHMIDAAKVSSLHVAVAISVYRWFGVGIGWVLVPLGFTIVAAVFFFGMILNDQLRRQRGLGARPGAAARSPLRSLAAVPTDYGVLCLAFLLLAAPPAFLVGYGVLFAGTSAYLLLAVVVWFREMQGLDRQAGA